MRIKLILLFVVSLTVLLLSRVYFLSIKSNTYYEELSKRNYIKTTYSTSVRGNILDRKGVPLAINELGFKLFITPHMRNVKKSIQLKKIIKTICQVFPTFDEKKLLQKYKKLDSPYRHEQIQLIDYITYDEFFPHYVKFNTMDDVEVSSATKRHYPYKEIGAHVLGYTGKATRKDMQNNEISKYTKIMGKTGIEKYYNAKLQGSLGERIVKVNALNKEIEVLEETTASSHNDIQISIDIQLQKYIHEMFSDKGGAIVVMDSNNGEILAAASFPEFDNNIFSQGISTKQWNIIRNDLNHPFTNKLVNGLYPPGSVIKMGMAISFLEHGLDPNFEVKCTGRLPLGRRNFRCWKLSGHKKVDYTKAIRESCDDFFYKGSLEIGINKISTTLDKFGFGKKTGIDQFNEFIGTNPNKAWKKNKYNMPWYIGETVVSSIGQGFIQVTPVQIAAYTASLTNSILPRPHFLKTKEAQSYKDLKLNKKHLKMVQKAMLEVTTHKKGTATKYVRTKNKIKIAAKTGTAQVSSIAQNEKRRMKEEELEYYKRSHAWMTTYAPYDNPQYVVTVLVEHGGHGGDAAGEYVAKIYDKLIDLGYIQKP
ncbi:MAG: penicillin-binding protein 2 [Campylobacterota bacterium]|nr:penicillin-binding protein 2 [Campylobacterota bacterium]